MSIPAPHFRQLYEVIFESISYHEKKLREMSQNASEDKKALIHQFQTVLFDLETTLDIQKDFSSRDIQQISFEVHKKINKIFKSHFYQEISLEEHENYQLLLHSLKQELKILKKTIAHQKEVEERGLESFLDTSWGWKYLEQLAKIGDPWALQTLRHFILRKHHKVFPFLIRNHFFKKLHPLIHEFKENPRMKNFLKIIVKKPEEERRSVYGFIFTVLETESWQWGQTFLEKQFEKDPLVAEMFQSILEKNDNPNHFINAYMIEQLMQESLLGIGSFAFVFSISNPKTAILIMPLIEMAFTKKSIHFDMLLLALTALSHQENGLFEEVKKITNHLEKERGKTPQSYQRILVDLLDKKIELIKSYQDEDDEIDIPEMKVNFTMARIFQMFALRKLELIEWLEMKMSLSPVIATPIHDDFPITPAVLVGWHYESSYFAKVISDILAPYMVTTYAPIPNTEKREIDTNSITHLPADYTLQIWQQDACFIGHKTNGNNFCQYPYWTSKDKGTLSDFIRKRIREHHLQEYEKLKLKDLELHSMGLVNEQQLQLHLFRCLLKTNPQIENQRFQFTFNEGGNCLIGQKAGKAYAIIGKDALDINRHWLTKELAQLGFKKNEHEQWELKEPYDEKELQLTEKDLKYFFAKDLGIEDPSFIYFIEQADFHIDMVMIIVGEMKVILNDSMLAYQKINEHYQQKKAALKYSPEKKEMIEQRLSLLLKNAKKMKFFEDAATSDLMDQGFEVIRFAGVFQDIFKSHPENHKTNLFNFLSLTTPQDQKLIISLGCASQYQIHFKEMLKSHCKVDHVYFLDQKQSEALLRHSGGIRCITKRCAGRF